MNNATNFVGICELGAGGIGEGYFRRRHSKACESNIKRSALYTEYSLGDKYNKMVCTMRPPRRHVRAHLLWADRFRRLRQYETIRADKKGKTSSLSHETPPALGFAPPGSVNAGNVGASGRATRIASDRWPRAVVNASNSVRSIPFCLQKAIKPELQPWIAL
jgi:hypothetical protein